MKRLIGLKALLGLSNKVSDERVRTDIAMT